jgi:hypothetical protein
VECKYKSQWAAVSSLLRDRKKVLRELELYVARDNDLDHEQASRDI